MKELAITGHEGFLARHLLQAIARRGNLKARVLPRETDLLDPAAVAPFVRGAHAVIHLAGVNRANDDADFETGNVATTRVLLDALAAAPTPPLLVYSSSMQAAKDTAYGRSKRRAEQLIADAGRDRGIPCEILRVTNIFGPGCRPFYNSVVATFCHQVARSEEPTIVQDSDVALLPVAKVAEEILRTAADWDGKPRSVLRELTNPQTIRVSALRDLLKEFHAARLAGMVPHASGPLERELYATYLTHLPSENWRLDLQRKSDARGDLVEAFRVEHTGQLFFSTSKPGVVRGNHYHTRKVERFLVVSGTAELRLRRMDSTEILSFHVAGDRPQVVEIPINHAHSIVNTGADTLLLLVWVNELFDPADPDTYPAVP